jgi:nicotinamidase-related amidase
MKKPALLIIDMQNDFVLDGAPLQVPGATDVIAQIQAIRDTFLEANLPVIHVMRVHRADGSDVEISRRNLFLKSPFAVEGTDGVEIIRELTPQEGEFVITKTRMSAFLFTELDLLLRSLDADGVVVTGIQTPNCIRATVFDAFAYNYETWLVDDAVMAKNPDIHQDNVRDMQNIGTRIITTDEVSVLLAGC